MKSSRSMQYFGPFAKKVKEGKESEERIARKGWRGEEGKDGEATKERIARKGQRGKDGKERKNFII